MIFDAGDRVHVATPRYEWTILRRATGGRGPCYISNVTSLRRPYTAVIQDGGPGRSVNDPELGGLFGFGLVAARPPAGGLDPATFWDWAWEVTTRAEDAYGAQNPRVQVFARGAETALINAACALYVGGLPVMDLTWGYTFGPLDEVTCTFVARPRSAPDLWVKEPKLTANGVLGGRALAVFDRAGQPLTRYDLTRLTDPTKRTAQVYSPRRFYYQLRGLVGLDLTYDLGLDPWATDAENAAGLSELQTPRYCLPGGHLLRQTEITRRGSTDRCGLMLHAWEGGYGAPDCWQCFRPWPTRPVACTLTAKLI